MSISQICLCISVALLLAVIVMRVIRSRRRKQAESQAVVDEMQERLREIDEYVAEGYYPLVKTLDIVGMSDERSMLLVQNALNLVGRGTCVAASLAYAQAVVYLKEPVDDDILREAVEKQGCMVTAIATSNQQVRKEPDHGRLLAVSDPHRTIVDYGN